MQTLKLRSYLFGVAVAAISGSGAALAQGADKPKPFSWTGFYVGASFGAHWVDTDALLQPLGSSAGRFLTSGAVPRGYSPTGSGAIAGLQAGYNQQFNGLVAGVEFDLQGSTSSGVDSQDRVCPAGACLFAPRSDVASSYVAELGWLATARARLGMLVTPTVLTYVTGGVAAGEVKEKFAFNGVVTNGTVRDTSAGSSEKTSIGWTVGGGFEWFAMERMTIKAEYLFVRLDGSNFATAGSSSDGSGCGLPANTCKMGVNVGPIDNHIARIGFNFKL